MFCRLFVLWILIAKDSLGKKPSISSHSGVFSLKESIWVKELNSISDKVLSVLRHLGGKPEIRPSAVQGVLAVISGHVEGAHLRSSF